MKRNGSLSRPSHDGHEWMVKTYLALRDLLSARSDKDADFLVEEAVFGRAADDEATWCTCAVTTRECGLAGACGRADVSRRGLGCD
jgi:hypothetical protein